GILYDRIEGGGIETTIRNICQEIYPEHFNIVLFLHERVKDSSIIPAGIKIVYLSSPQSSRSSIYDFINELKTGLEENSISILMHWWIHGPALLWITLLCHLMDIAVLTSIRFDHNFEVISRRQHYPHTSMLNTLRCIDKISCLNISSEIYLRLQGIDAIYLPNTVRQWDEPIPCNKRENNIAVSCRLHDRKKGIRHCLLVLKEVLRYCPNAKMIFIGSFEMPEREKIFYERAKNLNLLEHIDVTGWIRDPAEVLDQCKVGFSASFMEGFPNTVADAQARGLPLVMYDLDISIADNNPSIIRVPQQDIKGAAIELANLLLNDDMRQHLSRVALENIKRFSRERFKRDILDFLKNFDSMSHMRSYSPGEYRRALQMMAWYAGKSMPDY
ncbi:MAG: glycosyltransferase family 4 protein, partial [Desulfovibrio sp.]|nr:glycosyltransferase family 4 protein [Desulfovibrio sp.]